MYINPIVIKLDSNWRCSMNGNTSLHMSDFDNNCYQQSFDNWQRKDYLGSEQVQKCL